MDIRSLTYFLEIAKVQNISKAADNLHMSQPPLSRQMQLLEEELGVQLLVRGKRKVTLTPEGAFLRDRATQMIELAEKTAEQIGDMGSRIGGKLFIGSIESISIGIMPRWICDFHKEYPEVTFNWWSGNSNDVLDRLEHGLVDIAVVRTPCDNAKFKYEILHKEPWVIYMNQDDAAQYGNKDTISLRELENVPLIIPSIKTRAREIRHWFHSQNLEPHILCEISPAMNAISLVEEKMGAAILPQSVVRATSGMNITMKKIIEPEMESEVIVAYNRNNKLGVTAEKFMEFILERQVFAIDGQIVI